MTYVVAVIWGRISVGRFARGVAPAQVVAFSTQSSLACLPVMVERSVSHLGVSHGHRRSGPATGGGGVPHYLHRRQSGRLSSTSPG
jgi:L-cystine uptake protein TcyP (sodium:dicarboxylate symporter family)